MEEENTTIDEYGQDNEQDNEQKSYQVCYLEGEYIHVLGITFNINLIDYVDFSTYITNYGRGGKNGKLVISINKSTQVETFPTDKETLLSASDTLVGIINELQQIKTNEEYRLLKEKRDIITKRQQTDFRNTIILSIIAILIIIGSVGFLKYYYN